jgi:hypothetical protein
MAKAEATAEELVATSHHMREALGTEAVHAWDPERRWRLRVEPDAFFFSSSFLPCSFPSTTRTLLVAIGERP